jgi:hypothetical protein
MAVNRDKPHIWAGDIQKSVALYNAWYTTAAPRAFADARGQTAARVVQTLKTTENLCKIKPEFLIEHPETLVVLRTITSPPTARERLAGLAGVRKTFVDSIEKHGRFPTRMGRIERAANLTKLINVITKLADPELFPWLAACRQPTEAEAQRAAYVIADRYCLAVADPIIRNSQERRQLAIIKTWLEARGYRQSEAGSGMTHDRMKPGDFSFRLNIPATLRVAADEAEDAGLDVDEDSGTVNIPVDAAIMPLAAKRGDLPLMVEAKSAGDFTNVNKRRKEEATKMAQLRATFGDRVTYFLFLCGYFNEGYLAYEASEGIDWVWEHRPDDLAQFGL